jgi:putrescine importer
MVVFFIIAAINVLASGDMGVTFTAKAFYNPETFSWSTIGQGAAIACFSFLGFDALTALAEDTEKPKSNLPRALILICLVMTVIYVVVSYLGQCLWPDFMNYTDPSAAIFDPILVAGGQILFTIVLVCQVIGMFAIALDMMAASTRLMFAMGREGSLPQKFFGHENPKTHVPTYNVILLTAITAAFIWADVNIVVTLITFGALFTFVLVNLSAIRYFFFVKKVRGVGKIITHLIFPIVGFLTSAYLWLSLGVEAQKLGFAWIAVGVIYLAIRTKGFRKPIDIYASKVDAQFAQQNASEYQEAASASSAEAVNN